MRKAIRARQAWEALPVRQATLARQALQSRQAIHAWQDRLARQVVFDLLCTTIVEKPAVITNWNFLTNK